MNPPSIQSILLVITDLVPYPSGNGPSILTWGLVEGLSARGIKTTVAVLCPGPAERHAERLRFLTEHGIEYRLVQPGAKSSPAQKSGGKLWPSLADVYPSVAFAAGLAETCREVAPDCVLAFSAQSIAPSYWADGPWPRRVLLCADLDHENRYYRFRHHLRYGQTLRRFFKAGFEMIAIRKLEREFMSALRQAEQIVSFAEHTAKWMTARGLRNVTYMPSPITDQRRPAPEVERPSKPRFLLLGGYSGLVTKTSMGLLANSILPALDREFGPSGYELHWVGSGAGMPAELSRAFERHQGFIRRGFVDDLAEEYALAHAVLVPTPIAIGTRTRLVEALSFGAAVVAHSSNLEAMPELALGENLRVADEGAEVAAACRAIIDDPAMAASLRVAGRKYFETYHDPVTAVARLVDVIERDMRAPR